jgi:hypothetical protein
MQRFIFSTFYSLNKINTNNESIDTFVCIIALLTANMTTNLLYPILLLSIVSWQIQSTTSFLQSSTTSVHSCAQYATDKNDNSAPEEDWLLSRLPTSVDDQVRQAAASLEKARHDGNLHRHTIRLLLPVIGATELDDWPGGARQMMQAAQPLVQDILKRRGALECSNVLLDTSDGVYAMLGQAASAQDDCCAVLLPSADTVDTLLQQWERQVGEKRDILQWKRRSDFGGSFSFFGRSNEPHIDYVEAYHPTFSLTNMICEGESIRILRSYPSPWRIFVRKEALGGDVDWIEIGSKEFMSQKPSNWNDQPGNQRDGGRLFDYGQPSYQEISEMLQSSPNWTPKNPAERAAAAFTFIKDSL